MNSSEKAPKCARPGCKKTVGRNQNPARGGGKWSKFCSHTCSVEARKPAVNESLDAANRQATGTESPSDLLKRENTHLRQELKRSTEVIKRFQGTATLEDRILRDIVEFIERNPYRPTLLPKRKHAPSAKDHEMFSLVSDAHFPEVVEPEATFGLTYNGDVCRRRMEYLRDTIIRYKDLRSTSYPTRKLTIGVDGDMLSGDIHEELEVTNEFPMTEAVTQMAYMLYDFGSACAEEFPEVEMIIMPGNHPRTTKKPRFKQKWNNWEYLMGKFVEALARERFKVTVPKALVHRFSIFDHRIGLAHGDGVKVQSFGGIPFYSLERRRNKLQSLLKTVKEMQLDLLAYGHFHQLLFEEGQGCSVVINGSIKGGDEFTIGSMYAAQPPVQALLTFHPKHGLTDLSRINLGHISAADVSKLRTA